MSCCTKVFPKGKYPFSFKLNFTVVRFNLEDITFKLVLKNIFVDLKMNMKNILGIYFNYHDACLFCQLQQSLSGVINYFLFLLGIFIV